MAVNPVISVQIPVRDGGSNFLVTLESLAAQDTGGIPWELVIADDGSAVPVEKEFASRLDAFPEEVVLRTVRIDGPGNRPVARNMAWQASTASLCLLMDADLCFDSDLLAGHVREHMQGSGDVVMGARINAWMPSATPWQKWFDTRAMGNSPGGPFPWNYFITGNLSLPRKILEESGGFDPAIDQYGGEDTELGYRLKQMGAGFRWVPDLKVYHRDIVTVRKHSGKMVEYGSSGLRYTLEKHPETRGLLGSSWVGPLSAGPCSRGITAMRLVTRIALLRPVYRSVLRYMELAGRPRFLFTYLSVGACLQGLRGKDFR